MLCICLCPRALLAAGCTARFLEQGARCYLGPVVFLTLLSLNPGHLSAFLFRIPSRLMPCLPLRVPHWCRGAP